MRKSVCAVAALALLLGAAQAQDRPAASERTGVRLAQACGYFAILGCYRDPASAEEWNAKIDFGHVIDTSSMRYPNFRAGFYCVVHGPTSRLRAEQRARAWRLFVPDAYAKSSC